MGIVLSIFRMANPVITARQQEIVRLQEQSDRVLNLYEYRLDQVKEARKLANSARRELRHAQGSDIEPAKLYLKYARRDLTQAKNYLLYPR